MKILVCGDRKWSDYGKILTRLRSLPPRTEIIHGGADGADSIGGQVAKELGLQVIAVLADWTKYGRAAGPIRNQRMLELHPDLVIAFHSNLEASKGTKNCLAQAEKLGIPTEVIK